MCVTFLLLLQQQYYVEPNCTARCAMERGEAVMCSLNGFFFFRELFFFDWPFICFCFFSITVLLHDPNAHQIGLGAIRDDLPVSTLKFSHWFEGLLGLNRCGVKGLIGWRKLLPYWPHTQKSVYSNQFRPILPTNLEFIRTSEIHRKIQFEMLDSFILHHSMNRFQHESTVFCFLSPVQKHLAFSYRSIYFSRIILGQNYIVNEPRLSNYEEHDSQCSLCQLTECQPNCLIFDKSRCSCKNTFLLDNEYFMISEN